MLDSGEAAGVLRFTMFLEAIGAPTAPPAALTGSRWISRRAVRLGVAALLGPGAGASALLLRSRSARRTLDADFLAVAPFDVFDTKPRLWREGLVDGDHAGRRGRADRASAEALPKRTGAGMALNGTLLPTGRDSVRLTASVVDATHIQVAAQAEVRGPAEQVDQLADSLTTGRSVSWDRLG